MDLQSLQTLPIHSSRVEHSGTGTHLLICWVNCIQHFRQNLNSTASSFDICQADHTQRRKINIIRGMQSGRLKDYWLGNKFLLFNASTHSSSTITTGAKNSFSSAFSTNNTHLEINLMLWDSVDIAASTLGEVYPAPVPARGDPYPCDWPTEDDWGGVKIGTLCSGARSGNGTPERCKIHTWVRSPFTQP